MYNDLIKQSNNQQTMRSCSNAPVLRYILQDDQGNNLVSIRCTYSKNIPSGDTTMYNTVAETASRVNIQKWSISHSLTTTRTITNLGQDLPHDTGCTRVEMERLSDTMQISNSRVTFASCLYYLKYKYYYNSNFNKFRIPSNSSVRFYPPPDSTDLR